MAFVAKPNIFVLVFILLSIYGALSTSATSLHQRHEKQNSRWFSDCLSVHRKLGLLDCGGGSANMNRANYWSESLKTSQSPPPAPVKRVATRSGIASPPNK
ncbi:hypothetical protein DCAR_0936130 [Daucus carota subsp. sativus]|uniref:Uncharacterized protein n=1 Tax=Daucus carota subsp. sativus TaxID=79200 RepID=A0A175YIN6_DAUCS|nr:PREDICTED: uncharacterized protein LOC108202263 [Daucus carota subsp. sativus]WOH16574.1 hypothetical protein DCAR_0936130 [Daucus carota subsp. sativus]